MRVVQVTPRTVYPPTQGGTHRAHGLVSSFPDGGATVNRFCQGGIITNRIVPRTGLRTGTVEIAEGYTEHRPANLVHDLASLPQFLFDVPNVALSSWLRHRPPRQLRQLLETADVVIVEGPLQVPGIAELVQRTPVIYSSHNVESERLRSLRDRRFGRQLHERLVSVERTAVRRADGLVCASSGDAETFRERYDASGPVHVAPNGTYADAVADEPATDTGEDETNDTLSAIFVGSDYGPNREGVQALFDVWRALEQQSVDIELQVVGDVCKTFEHAPSNVSLRGFVDDLSGVLRQSDIALNSIRSGGGSNVKMLDYFAAGLAVVSTPFGARGFDVTDGEELLICDLEGFADGIAALQSETKRRALGERALSHVRRHHIWESISGDLLAWCQRNVC